MAQSVSHEQMDDALASGAQQAARYRPSVGWQTPALDVASETGDLPIVAAGESGEVVAVWYGAYPYAAGATVFR